MVESTRPGHEGEREEIRYDFLVNATGPKLNFGATEGLGPGGHSLSVCTESHAAETARALDEAVARMRRGERQRFLVGTGHGACTCEGAAFEYIVNLEFELRARRVRDKADIIWITNEYELGDFGMGGMHIRRGGYVTPEQDLRRVALRRARHPLDHPGPREQGRSRAAPTTRRSRATTREAAFDFAMLLPPFSGVGLKAFDRHGADITPKVFQPNGFMKVDADYTAKPYEEWSARGLAEHLPVARLPERLRGRDRLRPAPRDLAAPSDPERRAGRAGAPAHGHALGDDRQGRRPQHRRHAARGRRARPRRRRWPTMGAACVASAGANPFTGTAVSMTVFPIVPDFERYPEYGRDLDFTFGEVGLAGHWIKILLHHLFLYKAKLRPGWSLIPE